MYHLAVGEVRGDNRKDRAEESQPADWEEGMYMRCSPEGGEDIDVQLRPWGMCYLTVFFGVCLGVTLFV